MQLVDMETQLFDPMKQKPLGVEAVLEKFGVAPDRVIDAQALIGDSVDNVPGAPGIGPKTAAELLNTFGSLEAILERANEIKQPKRRETLINFADQIRLSKQLVTLKDDVPVEEAWESFTVRDPEAGPLLQFIDAMEFRTLGRRVREHFAKEKGVEIVAQYAAGQAAERAPANGPVVEPVETAFKRDAYKIVRDLPALEAYIACAMAAGAVGIDTEADGVNAVGAEIVGVALSLTPMTRSTCRWPRQRRYPRGRIVRSGASAGGCRAGRRPKSRARRDRRAKPLLEAPAVLKIGMNIKWDVALFAQCGVALSPVDDPMLISYALFGGLDPHDKTALVEKHLGHGLTPLSDVIGKGKAQIGFGLAAPERAAAYSAEQADAALRLWRKLTPDLAREKLRAVYETLERPLPPVLAAMEREGVRIDPHMLSRLSGDFAQRMGQYESEAYGLAGRAFNLGSPKQLGEILFDELKLQGGGKTKTGAWSTGCEHP